MTAFFCIILPSIRTDFPHAEAWNTVIIIMQEKAFLLLLGSTESITKDKASTCYALEENTIREREERKLLSLCKMKGDRGGDDLDGNKLW